MNRYAKMARITGWLRRFARPVASLWHSLRSVFSFRTRRHLLRNTTDSQRLFLANFAVATTIAVIVGLFHQNQWLMRLENSAMDLMMEFNKGLPRMSNFESDEPLQFAFLDIDEQSFRAWNEPYHTPRDKLQKLIDYAATGSARLIVVDIDLSRAGIIAEHDKNLADYLSRYATETSLPPLILVRNFYSDGGAAHEWSEIQPSFLDNFELSESIQWAQPLFRATLWDGMIRHWHLVKAGCLNGQLMLLPAVQLVVAGILTSENSASAQRPTELGLVKIESCHSTTKARGESTSAGAARIHGNTAIQAGIDQRIIYTIPWRSPSPDLVTVSAQTITEASRALSTDLVNRKVVIIGASNTDSRDIHRTPIGNMPGALIVANAIKSLALYGQIEAPPIWLQWVLKLSIILLAGWTFLAFRSLLAVGVAGGLIILVLVPISFHFFKYGLWVDFAIPLFGMLVHRAFAEYRGAQREVREISKRYRSKVT